MRERLGATVAWGVAIAIGVPLLAVLALVTLVGIPFGVALLLAAIPVLVVAYVTSAWIVGRRVLRNRSTSPWVALLAGWGILRVLALIPVAGALVGLAATVVGLGALAVALWRAGRPGEARGAGSGPSRTGRLMTVADSMSRGAGDATAVRVCGPTNADCHRGIFSAAAHLAPTARIDAVREQWSSCRGLITRSAPVLPRMPRLAQCSTENCRDTDSCRLTRGPPP